MKKIKRFFKENVRRLSIVCYTLLAISYQLLAAPQASAADLFDSETPIINNIKVNDASNTFAEIYQKLDAAKFGGKDIRVALESLETVAGPNSKIHIAATDNRVVIVNGDNIIGTWPRPAERDWRGFGQVTTALLLKIREASPAVRAASQESLYAMTTAAITNAIDANGKYIAPLSIDDKIITSAGFEGVRDRQGFWLVTGVIKGSQADDNNIADGDVVIGINGFDVSKMKDAEVMAELSGFNSGTLKMKVVSATAGSREIVLRRATVAMADADVIEHKSTASVLPAGALAKEGKKSDSMIENPDTEILELVVYKLSSNAVEIIRQALEKYNNATGIILDLRVAGGGNENAAAQIAGMFMGQKKVMRAVEADGSETEIIAGGDAMTNARTVVLISGNTSGAAEGLAMAFYEAARGALIGTPTAGDARLTTVINLSNGGTIELGNRSVKSAQGKTILGRGVFPIVCLSNIRNSGQQEAFFVNVINGDFNVKDFNADENTDADTVRKGCPTIRSGADEDAVAAAVAMKILTDKSAYDGLIVGK